MLQETEGQERRPAHRPRTGRGVLCGVTLDREDHAALLEHAGQVGASLAFLLRTAAKRYLRAIEQEGRP